MMMQRYVVMASAWLEIVVGILFIAVPNVLSVLLFGAEPEGAGMALARWVGVGLLGLGIACLPSKAEEPPHGSTLLGLLVFNGGLAILLAWVGVTTVHGFLLWPGVILHAVFTIAMLQQFFVGAKEGRG